VADEQETVPAEEMDQRSGTLPERILYGTIVFDVGYGRNQAFLEKLETSRKEFIGGSPLRRLFGK